MLLNVPSLVLSFVFLRQTDLFLQSPVIGRFGRPAFDSILNLVLLLGRLTFHVEHEITYY